MSNLNYKTIMGDILVFKDKNCMTIHRGNDGVPWVYRVEIDGEEADVFDDNFVSPFTREEEDYFIKNYESIVGPKY